MAKKTKRERKQESQKRDNAAKELRRIRPKLVRRTPSQLMETVEQREERRSYERAVDMAMRVLGK